MVFKSRNILARKMYIAFKKCSSLLNIWKKLLIVMEFCRKILLVINSVAICVLIFPVRAVVTTCSVKSLEIFVVVGLFEGTDMHLC